MSVIGEFPRRMITYSHFLASWDHIGFSPRSWTRRAKSDRARILSFTRSKNACLSPFCYQLRFFFENRVFRNLKIEVINARKRADILIDIPRHMTWAISPVAPHRSWWCAIRGWINNPIPEQNRHFRWHLAQNKWFMAPHASPVFFGYSLIPKTGSSRLLKVTCRQLRVFARRPVSAAFCTKMSILSLQILQSLE